MIFPVMIRSKRKVQGKCRKRRSFLRAMKRRGLWGQGENPVRPVFPVSGESPVPKALQGRRGLRAPQAPWDRKESPAHEDRQDRPDTHRTAYLRRFQRKI